MLVRNIKADESLFLFVAKSALFAYELRTNPDKIPEQVVCQIRDTLRFPK